MFHVDINNRTYTMLKNYWPDKAENFPCRTIFFKREVKPENTIRKRKTIFTEQKTFHSDD